MKKRALVISPHPDDETLGVGGTIAKYNEQDVDVTVLTIAGHRPPLYAEEDYQKTVSEAKNAYRELCVKDYFFLDHSATLLDSIAVHELNKQIYGVIQKVRPHIVFCPYPDRHVDHRIIFDSIMVATRPIKEGKSIEILAAYETLSETHWNAPHIEPNFTPNWVVDISGFIDVKLGAMKCYKSQISEFPGPRSLEAIKALATFRGTQAGFAYGEGFHIIRKIS